MSKILMNIQKIVTRTKMLYIVILFLIIIESDTAIITDVSKIVSVMLRALIAYGLIIFFVLTIKIRKLIFKSFYVIFVYLTLLTVLLSMTSIKSFLNVDTIYYYAQVNILTYIIFLLVIIETKNSKIRRMKHIQRYRNELLILFQFILNTALIVIFTVYYKNEEYYNHLLVKEFIFTSLLFYILVYFYVYNNNVVDNQENFMLNLYKPRYYKMFGNKEFNLNVKSISCFHVGDDIKILYKYEYYIEDIQESILESGALLMFDASKDVRFYISKNNKVYNLKVILEKNDVGYYRVKNTYFYESNILSAFLHNKFSNFWRSLEFSTIIINKIDYLKFMFDNNIYYKNNIENELDNTLSKKVHEEQNIICINGKYGEGKTTYLSTLTGLLNNDTTFFSYSSYKYEDILSEILLSFTKFFKPHILILVGIFFAVFTFVVSTIINIIDGTKIAPVVVIQFYNSLKGAFLYMLDVNPLVDTSSSFFKTTTETDVLIILSIIFLVALVIVLKSKETFLLAFNFGTSKTSNNIINTIADKLEKTDKKIIIEDLDRLDFYEDIYYEMLKISKLHNNNSKNINIYLTVGIDIIKKKYAEHMISKNLHNIMSYNRVVNWCIRNKPCEKCPGRNQCDLYGLLNKNFIIHNTYFKDIHADYIDEIKNVDYKLYKHLNSIDITDMRELKKEILHYYS